MIPDTPRALEHCEHRPGICERLKMSRPQFCYVLTTTGRDTLADMTYASVMFLSQVHPEAEIICLCDSFSHGALVASGHPLLEIVDRTHSVETPEGSPGYRNRFVKTQLRQVMEGDFVYFDSDTLVANRLDEMLACRAPMAAVANQSGTGDPSEMESIERDAFKTMSWEMPSRTYINGGVLYLRDTEATRRFGHLWHDKWLAWSRLGKYTDQPSLNSALNDSQIEYTVLGGRFNAQIGGRPSACREPAAVWHIYSSQSEHASLIVPRTILDEAITRFRIEGRLTVEAIREMSRWPYPWRTPTWLDRWYVRHFVENKDSMRSNSASRYWLAGHRARP